MNVTHRTPRLTLLAMLALPLAGCQGVVWANMAVLGVTFGLFFGTLNLGRRATPTKTTPAAITKQLPSSD